MSKTNETKEKKERKTNRKRKQQRFTQDDFTIESLGENKYPNPLKLSDDYFRKSSQKILYNNSSPDGSKLKSNKLLYFNRPGPYRMIHFDPDKTNVGIVTCGGLCPGLNDVIRAITYNCLSTYKIKTVYGFRYGYEGLTRDNNRKAIELLGRDVDHIHELGGTILGSSRGHQDVDDMVDTLVKFNISILFVIGGDGTQRGSMALAAEIKRRKLDISIIGIPKTIDNDLSFIHKTFGFYTAVEEAKKAIVAAHIEAQGARNGIGLVKLMGRHSGFIAAHATLAAGCVNLCLVPEIPLDLNAVFQKIEHRLENSNHMVIVVSEGVGQELLYKGQKKVYDASGNLKLKDIGAFLKKRIDEHLTEKQIVHALRYIDPSYMIRSTPANAADSSFCLRLGNYAVHAGMAGDTNVLIGYWNQHFTITPIKLAVSSKKLVGQNSSLWHAIEEITL